MKNRKKILYTIIVFLLASYIFSNWEDFKAGLNAKPPVNERIKNK